MAVLARPDFLPAEHPLLGAGPACPQAAPQSYGGISAPQGASALTNLFFSVSFLSPLVPSSTFSSQGPEILTTNPLHQLHPDHPSTMPVALAGRGTHTPVGIPGGPEHREAGHKSRRWV